MVTHLPGSTSDMRFPFLKKELGKQTIDMNCVNVAHDALFFDMCKLNIFGKEVHILFCHDYTHLYNNIYRTYIIFHCFFYNFSLVTGAFYFYF